MGPNPTRGSIYPTLTMKSLIYHTSQQYVMTYKYSIGDTVSIKGGDSGDVKRFPEYIRGKTGVIQAARGPFKNPRDRMGCHKSSWQN